MKTFNKIAIPILLAAFTVAVPACKDDEPASLSKRETALAPKGLKYMVSTVVGNGDGNVDGPVATAKLFYPNVLTGTPDGTIYVGSFGTENRIRKIKDGIVSTLKIPSSINVVHTSPMEAGPNGDLYFFNQISLTSSSLYKMSKEGKFSLIGGCGFGFKDGKISQAKFRALNDMAIAKDGTIYVVDIGNKAIRKICPNGMVTTMVKMTDVTDLPWRVALAPDGTPFISVANAVSGEKVYELTPEGELKLFVTLNKDFQNLYDMTFDSRGFLYVTDPNRYNSIYQIDPTGELKVLQRGSGYRDGPITQALFRAVGGIIFNKGNLYVADYGNHAIRKIALD
jgi:DNA-binding beta-propeller fold protein YncE